MSDKILRLLDSGEFRRKPKKFKAAVFETALRRGLIGYSPTHDVFCRTDTKQILLGLLPDADGRWTVLD